MRELGFDQISIEPVVADPELLPIALTEEDLPRIYEEYENLAREIIQRKKRETRSTFSTSCWILTRALAPSNGCAGAAAAMNMLQSRRRAIFIPAISLLGWMSGKWEAY